MWFWSFDLPTVARAQASVPPLKLRALPWGPFRYLWNKIRADLPRGVLRPVCVPEPCADLHELSEALTASDVHFTRSPRRFQVLPSMFPVHRGLLEAKVGAGRVQSGQEPGLWDFTSFSHRTLTWDTKSSTSLWGDRERGVQRGGHPPFFLIILSLYL